MGTLWRPCTTTRPVSSRSGHGIGVESYYRESGMSAYFCHVVDDDGQQRNLLEKFIDEGLAKHRQNLIQGKPPLVYAELMSVAQTVVLNYNGRSYQLFRKIYCYSSYRMVKAKEIKITELNQTISHKNSILSANKREGFNGGGGRGGAGGGRKNKKPPGAGNQAGAPMRTRTTFKTDCR